MHVFLFEIVSATLFGSAQKQDRKILQFRRSIFNY